MTSHRGSNLCVLDARLSRPAGCPSSNGAVSRAFFGLGLAAFVACANDGPANSKACGLPIDPVTGAAMLVANGAHNYAFSSTLQLGVTQVAPKSDLSFDWSGVTQDMLGHPIEPKSGVDMFNLLLWSLTQEQLELKLNNDQLSQKDLVAIATMYTNQATTNGTTRDLTSFGQPIDHEVFLQYFDADVYAPANYTYTVMVASGTVAGQGIRMLRALKLDPTSTNTEVSIGNDSTKLTYAVDLHSLEPTRIPTADSRLAVDWSGLDEQPNAMGQPFVATRITRAKIASYALPIEQLESRFLDLDRIAEQQWQLEIESGTVADFSAFQDQAGLAFPGIDGAHTWLLALECGSCRNPAPWYLSVLTSCN